MTGRALAMPALSRRQALGGLVAGLSVGSAAVADPFWWGRALAVNAFGVRQDLTRDWPGTLGALRAIGFRRIEMVSFRGWDRHPYGDFGRLAALDGAAVNAALKAADLTARSCHVLAKELEPQALATTLRWLAPIGINTLVLAGLPLQEMDGEAQRRQFAGLDRLGATLKGEGMSLMVHGEPLFWKRFDGQTGFEIFTQSVDPAQCRLQLDLGSALQMGVDPVSVLRAAPRHIGSAHLRDGAPPFDPERYVPAVPLGQGVAPIWPVVAAARKAGISDFVLEMVMKPEGGEIDALRRSYAYLRQGPEPTS